MDFIDKSTRKLVHAHFKIIGIDKEKKQTIIKPQVIQYNERKDKFYYKYLRVVEPKVGINCIKEWAVNKPSDKLLEEYEKKKHAYTGNLNNEIIAALIKNQNKEKKECKPKWECKECGHTWTPRGEKPGKCPKCQKFDTHTPKTAAST
jgi:rubrerythrin